MDGVLAANMVFEQIDDRGEGGVAHEAVPPRHVEGAGREPRGAGRRYGAPGRRRSQSPAESQSLEIKWSKAPCRFCGTGCGVMVGVKDGQVVATHGDIKAEVNRGLNCVKGYFLSKIMYGADRLTTPLLRKKDGAYDKDGEFAPVSLGRGLRRDGRQVQAGAARRKGRPPSACSARASGRSGRATPRRSS